MGLKEKLKIKKKNENLRNRSGTPGIGWYNY